VTSSHAYRLLKRLDSPVARPFICIAGVVAKGRRGWHGWLKSHSSLHFWAFFP